MLGGVGWWKGIALYRLLCTGVSVYTCNPINNVVTKCKCSCLLICTMVTSWRLICTDYKNAAIMGYVTNNVTRHRYSDATTNTFRKLFRHASIASHPQKHINVP